MQIRTQLNPSQIEDLAVGTGITVSCEDAALDLDKDGRYFYKKLRLHLREHVIWSPRRRGHVRVTTGVAYQRTSQTTGRRVNAVCWHGYRDFLRALFDLDPEATVKSSIASYKNREDFLQKFPGTRRLWSPPPGIPRYADCTCCEVKP